MKNGQILLYCRFNKFMKGPGTIFPSPALSQKDVRIFSISTLVLDQISF